MDRIVWANGSGSWKEHAATFQEGQGMSTFDYFLDEIDGLAPERTGRQDQSHISLVSTLLVLMDGLDDRGQVVVIGATNRSTDWCGVKTTGALRPGIFFGLPDEAARAKILKFIRPRGSTGLKRLLAKDLANRTSGYSGADMKVSLNKEI